ncbi:MAG: hypothetical protein IPO15_11565 [Anaerolineae bacterium]|uniref:hypothetical protein n=1 Tax=Candidatus Amarolinea dominans TaxID=3140696 RepID=UPI00313718B7|nr:hypothetical protein [Anaerolineae bacterium]
MGQVRRYSRLYWLFLPQRLKILMEYRANFLIGAASTVSEQAAGLLMVWVVMRQIPNLAGWSFYETPSGLRPGGAGKVHQSHVCRQLVDHWA